MAIKDQDRVVEEFKSSVLAWEAKDALVEAGFDEEQITDEMIDQLVAEAENEIHERISGAVYDTLLEQAQYMEFEED